MRYVPLFPDVRPRAAAGPVQRPAITSVTRLRKLDPVIKCFGGNFLEFASAILLRNREFHVD